MSRDRFRLIGVLFIFALAVYAYREFYAPAPRAERGLSENLREVVASLGPGNSVEQAMRFVHENSAHQVGTPYERDGPQVVARLLGASRGAEKPGISCGPRSLAMQAIVTKMGRRSHIVNLFGGQVLKFRGTSY